MRATSPLSLFPSSSPACSMVRQCNGMPLSIAHRTSGSLLVKCFAFSNVCCCPSRCSSLFRWSSRLSLARSRSSECCRGGRAPARGEPDASTTALTSRQVLASIARSWSSRRRAIISFSKTSGTSNANPPSNGDNLSSTGSCPSNSESCTSSSSSILAAAAAASPSSWAHGRHDGEGVDSPLLSMAIGGTHTKFLSMTYLVGRVAVGQEWGSALLWYR